jgi:MYXO-CTERM domain-containing protein
MEDPALATGDIRGNGFCECAAIGAPAPGLPWSVWGLSALGLVFVVRLRR